MNSTILPTQSILSQDDIRRQRRAKYKELREKKISIINAAIVAGFPRSVIAKRSNAPSVSIKNFNDLFERQMFTDNEKVKHAIEGINATKIVLDKDGCEHEYPDHHARHKYFKTILEMCDNVKDSSTTHNSLNMFTSDEFVNILRESRLRARDSIIDVKAEE